MLRSGTAPRRSAGLLILLLASWAGIHGCATPPTRPPVVPSGGQVLVLSFAQYQASVAPVLERQGCDAGGDCHGGGIRGTFQLSPTTAKDLVFDFDQVCLQTYPVERDSSPILTRPLAITAGGTPHPFKPFATTSDTDYVSIRTWIMAGTLQ